MTQPFTSIDSSTGHFKISWASSATNGDTIDQYLIEIESEATTSWVTDSMCDGSSLLIIALRYCLIPMSILRDTVKYGFEQGDIPQVRISAHNSFGWGDTSPVPLSSGAAILVEPWQMTDPYDTSATTSNSITIKWDSLTGTNTGGSSILSYNLIWD